MAILETRLKSFQAESLGVYKQVKEAMLAAEHATIQRDQAFAREGALAEEVKQLQRRLTDNAGKIDAHMMKLLQRKVGVAADELRATQNKLKLSESNNSELRAASVSKMNEINRLNNMRHEASAVGVSGSGGGYSYNDDVGDVPFNKASSSAAAARLATRSQYNARMETAGTSTHLTFIQTAAAAFTRHCFITHHQRLTVYRARGARVYLS